MIQTVGNDSQIAACIWYVLLKAVCGEKDIDFYTKHKIVISFLAPTRLQQKYN